MGSDAPAISSPFLLRVEETLIAPQKKAQTNQTSRIQPAMQIQKNAHEGWPHNAVLSNNHVELIVTLDVGPRVISYRTPGGHNVFKNYKEQLGGSGRACFGCSSPAWLARSFTMW